MGFSVQLAISRLNKDEKIIPLFLLSVIASTLPAFTQDVHQFIPISIPTRIENPLEKSLAADLYTSDTNYK
jgi:hypothetical protein